MKEEEPDQINARNQEGSKKVNDESPVRVEITRRRSSCGLFFFFCYLATPFYRTKISSHATAAVDDFSGWVVAPRK